MKGDSVTHIAGPAITACGLVMQRCSLCGAILCDSRNVGMPEEPDGSTPVFPTWAVGRLVRITAGFPECREMLDDTDQLPDDSCLDTLEVQR